MGTLPPIQWAPCRLPLKVKQVGHEADNLSTTNDKFKDGVMPPSPPHTFSRCATQLSMDATLPLFSIQIIGTKMALIILCQKI